MTRLLPCLFDRLKDDRPDLRREEGSYGGMSIGEYRNAVLEDLGRLLNARPHLVPANLRNYPELSAPLDYDLNGKEFEAAATSVLSYGTEDLAGRVTSQLSVARLANEIQRVIRVFEPRIIAPQVKAVIETKSDLFAVIRFEIQGKLWCLPVPEEFHRSAALDLETGDFKIDFDR